MKEKRPIPPTDKKNPHFTDRHIYPPSEDIYNQLKEEADIDPEDVTKTKSFIEIEKRPQWNEKSFSDDVSGSDLDIPGAELDDEMEAIGSEDEENNGYGLGGDNHQDLEENRE